MMSEAKGNDTQEIEELYQDIGNFIDGFEIKHCIPAVFGVLETLIEQLTVECGDQVAYQIFMGMQSRASRHLCRQTGVDVPAMVAKVQAEAKAKAVNEYRNALKH